MKSYLISHASELLEEEARSSQGNLFSGGKNNSEVLGLGEKIQNTCEILAQRKTNLCVPFQLCYWDLSKTQLLDLVQEIFSGESCLILHPSSAA